MRRLGALSVRVEDLRSGTRAGLLTAAWPCAAGWLRRGRQRGLPRPRLAVVPNGIPEPEPEAGRVSARGSLDGALGLAG